MELDALLQRAAENKQRRLTIFLIDVDIAASAKDMGPVAMQALSQYTSWTTPTINRLAMLKDLPVDLIDPELALGVYWCAHQNSATPEECFDWIRKAQAGQWSLAGLKGEMGLKEEREPPIIAPTEAEIVSVRPIGIDESFYRLVLAVPGPAPMGVTGGVRIKVW